MSSKKKTFKRAVGAFAVFGFLAGCRSNENVQAGFITQVSYPELGVTCFVHRVSRSISCVKVGGLK